MLVSENFSPGMSGFRLKSTGEAEFEQATLRGSLSGKLMNGEHLRIHTSHIIRHDSMPNMTTGDLFRKLKALNVAHDPDYPVIICSGFIYYEQAPGNPLRYSVKYVRTWSPSRYYLVAP